MRKFIISLLFIGLFYSFASANGISVSQSLDKTKIAFEDSVIFEITLQWEGGQSAYLFTKPLNPNFNRLKIRGFSSSISMSQPNNKEITTKKYDYVLKPISSGVGSIDPVTISYISWPDSLPGELVTEAMTVTIAKPVKKEEKAKVPRVWIFVFWAVIVLGGVFFIIKRKIVSRRPKEPVKTPKDKFLESLTMIKKDAGTDLKKFQAGFYKIVKEFLRENYGISLEADDSDNLKEQLKKTNLSPDKAEKIYQWIVKANKDKYSPNTGIPGETIRLESEIRDFFEKL
ncbi:MAG: hypothetical protein GXO93_07200 [FCB group bacterium]|nr:hypothetical protein [FCB group bacterium]